MPASFSATSSLSHRRKLLYAVILALVFIGVIELAGRIILAVSDARPDTRARLPWYARRAWSAAYWGEFDRQKMRFEPHVGWRRRDFAGDHINIRDGERAVIPDHATGVTVWCLGGSAMWGTGARDAHTIPSYLAQLAEEAGLPVRVRNLSETGWVSTQEMIDLMLRCRSGEKPDIALFYDGVNDVYSAFQSGRADGSTQNRELWEAYFDSGVDPKRHWLRNLAMVRLTRAALRRMGLIQPGVRSAIEGYSDAQRNELAGGVARTYLENLKFLRRVTTEYPMGTLFFWQPIVADQDKYESGERSVAGDVEPAFFALFEQCRQRVMADGDGPIDLSGALGPSPPDGFFIDAVHLNEDGNAAIARAIFEHLRPLIVSRATVAK